MANQFTKGTRTKHDEQTKDKIRAELLSQRLYKFAKSKPEKRQKIDMTPAQVAAAKVLIERGKPALQSIEQRTVDPIDEMSPQELERMAQALITAHPELLRRFQPSIALASTQPKSDTLSERGADTTNEAKTGVVDSYSQVANS